MHSFKRWQFWVLLAAVVVALAAAALPSFSAVAGSPAPTATPVITDDQVNAIAHTLYCPVCENTPLDVCGTKACAQWRELIRQQLQQGWTKEQIQQYFVDRYGARVLAAPPRKGFWWLAYVVPPLAILAGLYLLYRSLKAWYKPRKAHTGESTAGAAPSPPQPAEDEYLQKLEEELRSRR